MATQPGLPLDVIRYLPQAADMTVGEILKLCQTNKRLQETLCNNRDFWISQAGKWLTSHPEELPDISIEDLKRHLHDAQTDQITGHNGQYKGIRNIYINLICMVILDMIN